MLYLKIRTYAGSDMTSVWLVERDGAAEQWRLFGEMTHAVADRVSAALADGNVPAEQEDSPLPYTPVGAETTLVAAPEPEDAGEGKQLSLFGDHADVPPT